jgi:hypothetical protein
MGRALNLRISKPSFNLIYTARSASTGFTDAARCAGIKLANIDAAPTNPATQARVITPDFYGSLPAAAEQGQVVLFETETRYVVYKIAGEGMVGDAKSNQEMLARSDISRGEEVPTIWLQEITKKIYIKGSGRSFSAEELRKPGHHHGHAD